MSSSSSSSDCSFALPRAPSASETLAIVGRVGRLDDVDEVVLAERRPLVQHLRAELLDVAVDLAQPARVRLQRLHALGVSVVSIRYVGIASPSRLGLDRTRAAWST